MTSFPIFKVNYLVNKNIIKKIFVFYGVNLEISDPNELFQTEPNNDWFKQIFNSFELSKIKQDNIEVIFIKDSIHYDDSIGTIKLKIINAFFPENTFSQEEVYLYCLKSVVLNPITVYQTLTLNDKISLTRIRLDQLLLNINDANGKPIDFNLPEKEKYTFDDILNLNLPNRKLYLAKILGQKIILGENEYPFVADPFYIQRYDVLLEKSRKAMSTMNNSLLLDTGVVYNNNIYL